MKKILKFPFFLFLGLIALAVVFAIVISTNEDTTETRSPDSESPNATLSAINWGQVTSHEILESNKIAGQQRFAELPIEVTGRIGRPDYATFSNNKRYNILLQKDDVWSLVSLNCG